MTVTPPLVRALRPRQWVKNVLVFAAPLAAGVVLQPHALLLSTVGFLSFCLAASGIYLVNDVADADADRLHPTKRRRPVAARQLGIPVALGVAAVLLLGSLALSALAGRGMVLVLLTYQVIQVAYCLRLKHEPVIELASVASGFLLRAIAGGVATRIELSQWFLMTAGFGSLFLAAGKRYAEAVLFANTGLAIRPMLSRYSTTYLRFVWTLAAGVMITSYSLWAFGLSGRASGWGVLSIVLFVMIVLRYGVDVDSGQAGEPEEILLRDRTLLAGTALWALTLVASIYA